MNRNRTRKNVLWTLSVVLTIGFTAGCNKAQSVGFASIEPSASERLVINTPGLGASDLLGAAVFVEDGYRFAMADTVFQMAALEDPTLNLSNLHFDPIRPTQDQVFVYGSQPRWRIGASESEIAEARNATEAAGTAATATVPETPVGFE